MWSVNMSTTCPSTYPTLTLYSTRRIPSRAPERLVLFVLFIQQHKVLSLCGVSWFVKGDAALSICCIDCREDALDIVSLFLIPDRIEEWEDGKSVSVSNPIISSQFKLKLKSTKTALSLSSLNKTYCERHFLVGLLLSLESYILNATS